MPEELEYDKFMVRIVIDLSGRSKDELIEEHTRWIQQMIIPPLNEFYGDLEVDLVFVTHEGKLKDSDPEEMHVGWGLSAAEMMDRIPGETEQEKRDWITRSMEGEDPE